MDCAAFIQHIIMTMVGTVLFTANMLRKILIICGTKIYTV